MNSTTSRRSFSDRSIRVAQTPTDVGGALRDAEFLAAIADPTHEEHESFREWSGGQFDPKRFDLEAINRTLSKIKA